MNRDILEDAIQEILTVLEDLAMPPEITADVQRVAGRVLHELDRRAAAITPGPAPNPTIAEEEITAQEAAVKICNEVILAFRTGAPPEQIRDMIREYLLHGGEYEQQIINSLLTLPLRAAPHSGGLH